MLQVEGTDETSNPLEVRQAIFDGMHWLDFDCDEDAEKGGKFAPSIRASAGKFTKLGLPS